MLKTMLLLLIVSGVLFYVSNRIQRKWMKKSLFVESNSVIVIAIFLTLFAAHSCDKAAEELKKMNPEKLIEEIKNVK